MHGGKEGPLQDYPAEVSCICPERVALRIAVDAMLAKVMALPNGEIDAQWQTVFGCCLALRAVLPEVEAEGGHVH